jgi:hypothetical protein
MPVKAKIDPVSVRRTRTGAESSGRITGNPEVIVSFGRVGRLDDPVALQRPLRVPEAISSTKFEVTNRPGTV